MYSPLVIGIFQVHIAFRNKWRDIAYTRAAALFCLSFFQVVVDSVTIIDNVTDWSPEVVQEESTEWVLIREIY